MYQMWRVGRLYSVFQCGGAARSSQFRCLAWASSNGIERCCTRQFSLSNDFLRSLLSRRNIFAQQATQSYSSDAQGEPVLKEEEEEDFQADEEPKGFLDQEVVPDVIPYVKVTRPIEEKRVFARVRVEMTGYDNLVLDQYIKTAKTIATHCRVRTSSVLGLPVQTKSHHTLTTEDRYPISYTIHVHRRQMMMMNVPTYKMDFIVETILQDLPTGISCDFVMVSASDIPEHLVSQDMRVEALRLAKKKKKKAARKMHIAARTS